MTMEELIRLEALLGIEMTEKWLAQQLESGVESDDPRLFD